MAGACSAPRVQRSPRPLEGTNTLPQSAAASSEPAPVVPRVAPQSAHAQRLLCSLLFVNTGVSIAILGAVVLNQAIDITGAGHTMTIKRASGGGNVDSGIQTDTPVPPDDKSR